MNESKSKLAAGRQKGRFQVDEQRARILDAAESLFLQQGLENTKMVDIANRVGINKLTLYRYFPNRDLIAVEIHVRMMNKISSLIGSEEEDPSPQGMRNVARSMIRNFGSLREAYRYMGMFDKLYLDHPPEVALTHWTKNQLLASGWKRPSAERPAGEPAQDNRIGMIMSTVVWFLEKLALRGELTWSDQAIPLEEHLKLFEEMIMGYFDRFLFSEDNHDDRRLET